MGQKKIGVVLNKLVDRFNQLVSALVLISCFLGMIFLLVIGGALIFGSKAGYSIAQFLAYIAAISGGVAFILSFLVLEPLCRRANKLSSTKHEEED